MYTDKMFMALLESGMKIVSQLFLIPVFRHCFMLLLCDTYIKVVPCVTLIDLYVCVCVCGSDSECLGTGAENHNLLLFIHDSAVWLPFLYMVIHSSKPVNTTSI